MWVMLFVGCGQVEEDSGLDPAARLPDYAECTWTFELGTDTSGEFRPKLTQVRMFDDAERLSFASYEEGSSRVEYTYDWADDRCWKAYTMGEYYNDRPSWSLAASASCDAHGFSTTESWIYTWSEDVTTSYALVAQNTVSEGNVTFRALDWEGSDGDWVERESYGWVGDLVASYDGYVDQLWSYHEEYKYDDSGNLTWAHTLVPGNNPTYGRWTLDEHGRILVGEQAGDSAFLEMQLRDEISWDSDRYVFTTWRAEYTDSYVEEVVGDCTAEWPWSCEYTHTYTMADDGDTSEWMSVSSWSCP